MKELNSIKEEMESKEMEITNSLILNTEHEKIKKNLKEKLKESEEQNYNHNKCENLMKLTTEGKNIETQTCQDCIGKT